MPPRLVPGAGAGGWRGCSILAMLVGPCGVAPLAGRLRSGVAGPTMRIQAAVHGRSVEDEARDILRCVLNQEPQGPRNLGTAIHDLFKPFGGFDMPEVPRDKMREPPRFDL